MAKTRIWRTAPTSVEGKNTVYLDGSFGDNEKDGTREKPYQTLDEAYYGTYSKHKVYPTKIVCVGPIRGDVVFNHDVTLVPDYAGAAWYDGEGKNIPMYAAAYTNMWLTNCFREWDPSYSQLYPNGYDRDKRAFLAGVGRAGYANNVGYAGGAYGVASGSVKMWRCQSFRGHIGSNGQSRLIFAKMLRSSPNCKCVLSSNTSGYDSQCTFYDCKLSTGHRDRRSTRKYITVAARFQKCLFSNFDIFVDDYQTDIFLNCYFDTDCLFIFKSGGINYAIRLDNKDADTRSHTLDSAPFENGEEAVYWCTVNGVQDIPTAITYLRGAGLITVTTVPIFTGCVWSENHASDIFVDAEGKNFSLHRHCDAVDQDNYTYYGAEGPAIELEIHENSDGHLLCWDSRTKEGCIDVEDGMICADETSKSGQIVSKIIKLNHHFEQISALNIPHEWKHDIGIAMTREDVWGDEYHPGDTLPLGIYKVFGSGSVNYTEEDAGATLEYKRGETIYVEEEGTTFENTAGSDCYLTAVLDLNPYDCVYVRCRQTVYAYANEGDTLVPGVWYMNENDFPITFRGRSIIPGESFCAEDALPFASENGAATLSILFDDVNGYGGAVPPEPWVTPAALQGSYFVSKTGTSIDKDTETKLWSQSSGNYRVWTNAGNGASKISGVSTIINQPYVQFALFVKRA